MRIGRAAVLCLLLLTLPTISPVWANAKDKHVKVTEYEQGHAYCPQRTLVIGSTIVPAGRCYKLAVLRDNRGAFLAFMNPAIRLPSKGIERLNDSEGRKVRGQIFFLVPIQTTNQIALIPVNSIQLVRLREEDEENEDEDQVQVNRSKLIVGLPNLPIPNVTVTFVITF